MTEDKEEARNRDKAKEKAESRISKDTLIKDVTSRGRETIELLMKSGLHCVGCPAVSFETLEQGCKAHGMSDEQVDELVEEINKVVGEKVKKSKSK